MAKRSKKKKEEVATSPEMREDNAAITPAPVVIPQRKLRKFFIPELGTTKKL